MLLYFFQNDQRNSALQMASVEQKKADENVLRLVEEQKVWMLISLISLLPYHAREIHMCKVILSGSFYWLYCFLYFLISSCIMQREKEEALKKVLELERNLDEKQKLEMEITELKGKLEVMKHLGGDDDAAVQQKINEMKELLQEKKEDLEGLEDLNTQLLSKERQSNDELQEARKELIEVWFQIVQSIKIQKGKSVVRICQRSIEKIGEGSIYS